MIFLFLKELLIGIKVFIKIVVLLNSVFAILVLLSSVDNLGDFFRCLQILLIEFIFFEIFAGFLKTLLGIFLLFIVNE